MVRNDTTIKLEEVKVYPAVPGDMPRSAPVEVLEDKPIEISVHIYTGHPEGDGILVYDKDDQQRVVIENLNGVLTVHLWADKEYGFCTEDPTHSISLKELPTPESGVREGQ